MKQVDLTDQTMTEEIQKLTEPNVIRFMLYVGLDWLGILAGCKLYLYHPSVPTFLAGSVILGLSAHGLIVLGHEAVHYRICKSRFWNEWLGRIFCFFPVTITVSSYREFHFPHHRDPFGASDPEVPLRRAMGENFAPPFTIARGMKLWALSFFGMSIKEAVVFGMMLPRGLIREKLYMAAFWTGVAAWAHTTGNWMLVAMYGVGLMTTYFSMLRIQGWYEHGLLDMNTNRYSLPNQLYRFVMPHNIWVHYEHHKYPSVPFYNLEKVRELDKSDRVYTLDEMVEAMTRDGIPQVFPKDYGQAEKKAA